MNGQTAFSIYTIRVNGTPHSAWVNYGTAETVMALLVKAGVKCEIEQAPAFDLEEWRDECISDAMRDC